MALNAYQTLVNQTAAKRALSGEEQERLRQIAAQQGAGAASSLALQMAQQGATAQPAQQTAMPDYVAASKAKSAANQAIIGGATAGQSVQAQNAYQKELANASQPSVNVTVTGTNRNISSGDAVSPAVQAALGTPKPAASAGSANTGLSNAPTMNGNYIWYGWMGDNKMTTMNDQDKANWNTAMKGWQNGDYNSFNENFQKAGNWSSYVDDKGNVNGMLRYVGDGVGGYVPVNGGQLLQNGFSGDLGNYAFYGPDGSVYTADANGRLTKAGNWTADYDQVMKNGYYYNNPNRYFQGKDGQFYTYGDVPDDKLAEWGYVRRNGGIFYEPQTIATNNALKNGDITPEQLAMAQAMQNAGNTPGGNVPTGSAPSGSTAPVGGSYDVTGGGNGQTTPMTGPSNAQTPEQAYLARWDYENAPEWEGSPYQQKQDESLDAAQAMKWEGSSYDPMVEEYLSKYGEDWQGSKYLPIRDDYAQQAANLRWDYDPNTDPVWQALQKQYRREGDRATQEALAQAAMRTGGLANSYAVTAASQAGDYYAAQLSDRLPELYRDAYQRYLDEYSRLLGLSDTYGQFDATEYSRWFDQQGKNLDMAKIYNDLSAQEYGRFLDEYNRKMEGADAYGKSYKTAYGEYLDRLDQWNKDRDFRYGIDRDNRADYENDRDFEEDRRRWNLNYEHDVDAQEFDKWYKTQNLTLDQAEQSFNQWYKARGLSMDEASQTFDHWYKKQLLDQDQQQNAIDNANKSTMYQKEIKTADDKRYKDGLSLWQSLGVLPERYAEIVGYPAGTRWEDVFGGMDAEEVYSGNTENTPPPGDDGAGGGFDLSKVGNRASQDWVALDDNQRVSWQELYTLVENGDVEEYYKNGKYYYRWKNMEVPEGKPKETTPKVVYENRGGR